MRKQSANLFKLTRMGQAFLHVRNTKRKTIALQGTMMTYPQRPLVLFALLIAVVLALPAPTLTHAQEDACGDLLAPRLNVGDTGRVVLGGGSNNMRDSASTGGALVTSIPEGGEFIVLQGATCADGYYWYEVDYNGIIGWTAESGGGDYWVELVSPAPDPNAMPEPTSTPAPDEVPLVRDALGAVNLQPIANGQARVITGEDTFTVRDQPTTAGTFLTRLEDGEVITITETGLSADGYNWVQLQTEGGTTGYAIDGYYNDENAFVMTLLPACPYTQERIVFGASIFFYYDPSVSDFEREVTSQNAIFSANRDGGEVCLLHVEAVYSTLPQAPFWSPDGTIIWFTSIQNAFMVGGQTGANQYYTLSPDGLQFAPIGNPANYLGGAVLAPDSNSVAFVRDFDSVWRMNADGSGAVSLGTYFEEFIGGIAWSNDAEALFVLRPLGVYYLTRDGSLSSLIISYNELGMLNDSGGLVRVNDAGNVTFAPSPDVQGTWEPSTNLVAVNQTNVVDRVNDLNDADVNVRIGALLPDGDMVIYAEYNDNVEGLGMVQFMNAYFYDRRTNTLTPIEGLQGVRFLGAISASGDEDTLYVISSREALHRIDLNTYSATRLIEAPNFNRLTSISVQP
jgi:uncharacterized protein YgiM (DUF1202 family)